MTDPTPPTPLELARVIEQALRSAWAVGFDSGFEASYRGGPTKGYDTAKAAQELLALTSPQHRAGIRREAFTEAANIALAIDSGRGNEKQIAAAILALGEKP